MSLLDQIIANDAAALVDADLMPGVESVTYKPHGGSPATIRVNVVSRMPPDVSSESGRTRNWHIVIFVRNSATTTIGRTSINTAGDLVTIPTTYGGTAVDLSVVEIINQSAAGWTLLLR